MVFFYLLNCIIFFRLFFLFRDKPISLKSIILLTFLQIVPLLILKFNLSLVGFIALILVINLLLFYFEKSGKLNLFRFASFLCLFITAGIFSSESFNIELNKSFLVFLKSLSLFQPSFLNITAIDYHRINIIIFGILILLNEINFLIRYFFEILKILPENGSKQVDPHEYNAGRVIGMLERILIYFFVLIGEITVIGFIVAAKGFTRFKELDKRDFAEYVLIGTLLSLFLALVISFSIKKILLLFFW